MLNPGSFIKEVSDQSEKLETANRENLKLLEEKKRQKAEINTLKQTNQKQTIQLTDLQGKIQRDADLLKASESANLVLRDQMNSMKEIQRRSEADLKTRDEILIEANASNSKLKAETTQLRNKISELTL